MKTKETKTEEQAEVVIVKRINAKGLHSSKSEMVINVEDEEQNEYTLVFNVYEFLNWFGTEDIEYLKKNLQKHIKNM